MLRLQNDHDFCVWASDYDGSFDAQLPAKACICIQARGDAHRNVCIIPVSAHGTNPASAAMCGMKIVTVGTDAHGNVDIAELRKAAETHKDNLSALMVSIHSIDVYFEFGVFRSRI